MLTTRPFYVRATESAPQILPVHANSQPATFLTHRWPAYTTLQSIMSSQGSQLEKDGIVLTIKGNGSRRVFTQPHEGMVRFYKCAQGLLQVETKGGG